MKTGNKHLFPQSGDIRRQNKAAIAVILVALIAVGILFTLPAFQFEAAVYTKKSPNTFVGDEKYYETLEEVNAVAEEYRAAGYEVEYYEDVTERVNSKGVTTSLITFVLTESFTKNVWSYFGAGLSSSYVLIAITVLSVAAAAFMFAGIAGSMETPYNRLKNRSRVFRNLSAWCLLFALLLVPVFVMTNTYNFSRIPQLHINNLEIKNQEELFQKMDAFLFGGITGDKTGDVLKTLQLTVKPTVWLAVPCFFGAMLGAIQLRNGSIKPTFMRGLLYAFVIIVCVITLYPYYVMLVTGFRSSAETNDMYFQNIFPQKWLFSNLKDIIKRGVPKYLLNSLMIAGGATGIAMLCGIPAAYALARKNFHGKKVFLGFIIVSQMFSPVVLMIGIYQLMNALSLNNTVFGLMLINAAFNQAFAIWLLRGTFVSISPEMEQAALIDGCNTFQSLTKILIPMAAPGIVTALIFVFINAWNEYTLSTVLISKASNYPITVGITQFSSFNMIEWQYLFAASLLATIPVVILFICIEKHLTSGLTSGGVKG